MSSSSLTSLVEHLRSKRFQAYHAMPADLREHHGIEQTVLAGGYGYRQVLELVQNGADAILEAAGEGRSTESGNRMEVLLHDSCLYVANTGAPLSSEGVEALLSSHSSPKRANQIGRFGLGFKSLLKLRGQIDIFSSTGSLRFDPERCRNELMREFQVSAAPGLRLAWALDFDSEKKQDPTLAKFGWATTVVRARINNPDAWQHIEHEIKSFPLEFLLFLSVPVALRLQAGEVSHQLTREQRSTETLLKDGEKVSRWRVVHDLVAVTDEDARNDATHIHFRDEIPISWAVPLDTNYDAGRFWAFFPTNTPTRLPGILNAPWKLNSDRNAIISGEWNTALMHAAAQLVARTLPSLATTEDPGLPLDAFPRQLERLDEAASPLVNHVWEHIEKNPSVPNASGQFYLPRYLLRHPLNNENLARTWVTIASADARARLVHASCLKRERDGRLNELSRRLEQSQTNQAEAKLRRAQPAEWFRGVASLTPEKAIHALRLAEAYAADCKQAEWETARPQLSIVPSSDGQLLAPNKVIIAPREIGIVGRASIADWIFEDKDAMRVLTDVLKVDRLNDEKWRQLLDEALRNIPDHNVAGATDLWRTFWARVRSAPENIRDNYLSQKGYLIRVRRRDGNWARPFEVLRPGGLVTADDPFPQNKLILVDETEHAQDAQLIARLGVQEFPSGVLGPGIYYYYSGGFGSPALWPWLRDNRQRYFAALGNGRRPNQDYILPTMFAMPVGWSFLPGLIGPSKGRLTSKLLLALTEPLINRPVDLQHDTKPDQYPKLSIQHPLLWLLLEHGFLSFGSLSVPLKAVVAYHEEPALHLLPDWPTWAPHLELLASCNEQHAPAERDIIHFWNGLIEALATSSALQDDTLQSLWSGAAEADVVPATLPLGDSSIPLSNVFVTGSPDLARRARNTERLVITLNEKALKLWKEKGALDLDRLLEPQWENVVGPADLFLSAFPEFGSVIKPELKNLAICQAVIDLKLRVDSALQSLPCLMWQGVLHVDGEQLMAMSRRNRSSALLKEIASAGWLSSDPNAAIQMLWDENVESRRRAIAAEKALAAKLLAAIGGRVEPLHAILGDLCDKPFLSSCTPLQLADVALALCGTAILSSLSDALAEEGLKPPFRWNGNEARMFVESIGFPPEYAASADARRDPEEIISGPIFLPPLHDFQEEVQKGLADLIQSSTGRRRAVVSLPTGGGKTRVVVQATVDFILKPESNLRSAVWIAQTDELCEQAVQAFRQVWHNRGASSTPLRIIRLWGGNPNPAPASDGMPVVVVASIQTLNNRVGSADLTWLSKPGVLVIDECHHAITKSYSNVLRWLDAEASKPGVSEKDEPPIIGLSATPFRGMDADESLRLAKRFDQRWFPHDQEGLYQRLRSQGVLALVEHESLESKATLLQSEIDKLLSLREPWEGFDFEQILETINQRLGSDEKRNQLLVDRIAASAEKSILFFANSVSHAFEMAARLHLRGIPAAAVSGETPTAARREFLDRFRKGDIRVLCNHSVLTTGFDAPKTDMVLIARQVFSPVRYMQMVGRGLRGVKNGGKEKCRLVTVVDNLGRFADKHPYHLCAKYFVAPATSI